MWIEYEIETGFERQREMIRGLRKWILSLEERGLVQGFAFDHYYNNPSEPDELCVRFDYAKSDDRTTVERELREAVREPVSEGHPWKVDEEVLKAYEFGSRCAFLFWELVESRRFPEDYTSNFHGPQGMRKTPFQFQWHFNHGVMNSLGIPKRPNEQILHLSGLMESTGSKNLSELCAKLQNDRLFSVLLFTFG